MTVAIVAPFFTPFIKSSNSLFAQYLAQAGNELHWSDTALKALQPRDIKAFIEFWQA